MKKQQRKDGFVSLPEYPGGIKAFRAYIQANLKYPKEALENRIEGRVYLQFQVNNNGSINKVKVRKGLGHGCDEEAVRVIKSMHFTPANNRGNKVSVKKKVFVSFKLPKSVKKAEKIQQVNYTIKKTEEALKKDTTGKKVILNYTIRKK